MSNEEHKKLLEHVEHLKKIIDSAPHDTECIETEYDNHMNPHFVLKCVCWKSKETIIPAVHHSVIQRAIQKKKL